MYTGSLTGSLDLRKEPWIGVKSPKVHFHILEREKEKGMTRGLKSPNDSTAHPIVPRFGCNSVAVRNVSPDPNSWPAAARDPFGAFVGAGQINQRACAKYDFFNHLHGSITYTLITRG